MSLETYMIVNFKAREISRGTRKLAWTPTLVQKKKQSCINYFIIIELFWLPTRAKFYIYNFNN